MAQLRDAHTSELIADGTPAQLVAVADELGVKAVVVGPGATLPDDAELVYDDVGVHFDPDAVRKSRDENLAGLAAMAKETASLATRAKGKPEAKDLRDQADRIAEAHKVAVAEVGVAKSTAEKAKKALDKARARVKG